MGTQKDSENSSLRKANEAVAFVRKAATILLAVCVLTGCDSLGMRDYFADDQVPQEAKDAPRLVASPPPVTGNEAWPLLGEVPSKPRDFSPKPVYDHYMDELAYDRNAAQAEKQEVEGADAATPMPDKNLAAPSATADSPAHPPISPQFIHP